MDKNFFKVSKRFFEYYDKTLDGILAALFCFMMSIVFIEIVGRFFFNFAIMFSEELARYMFIGIVLLGAARAFTLKRHLAVDFFISKIKKRSGIYINISLYILIMLFLFYLFLQGIKYSSIYWKDPFHSTQFLKLGWVYSVVPIASILMILNILRVISEILHKKLGIKEKNND